MSLCPIQRAGTADLKWFPRNLSYSKQKFRSRTGLPQTDRFSGQTTPGYVVDCIVAFFASLRQFLLPDFVIFYHKKTDL